MRNIGRHDPSQEGSLVALQAQDYVLNKSNIQGTHESMMRNIDRHDPSAHLLEGKMSKYMTIFMDRNDPLVISRCIVH